jgi:hypothetical protein
MPIFSADGWSVKLVPAYQLRIELVGTKPTVWRRVIVPPGIKLPKLHETIQAAMGWHGGHMHEFIIGEEHYGVPYPGMENDPPLEDERRKSLKGVLGGIRTFRYIYDFGDYWDHKVKLEKILPDDGGLKLPMLTGGANAAPPEDVGGVQGYRDFLAILADPKHEEHQSMLEWIGGAFDPTTFDDRAVDARFSLITP